jgi:hypothetical protein
MWFHNLISFLPRNNREPKAWLLQLPQQHTANMARLEAKHARTPRPPSNSESKTRLCIYLEAQFVVR